MRFVRYAQDGKEGLGVEIGSALHGVLKEDPGFPGTLAELVGDASALKAAGASLAQAPEVPLQGLRHLPPFPAPSKILCVGLNYHDHTSESGYDQPAYPTIFSRFSSSLIGHGEPIVRPQISETLDFEGELVAVIGRKALKVSQEAALDHVAGYSIFNDGSIRAYQHLTPQWTIGKNFDGTGAFGPVFVTADEVPDGGIGRRLQTRLNGQVVQSAMIDNMVFSVAELVSILSQTMTLMPGDVIVTGTPSGVGGARKPPLWMRAGDLCEVEIDGIGILSNPIRDEAAAA